MIRERLQQAKAALMTRVNSVREAVEELAVDSLDNEVTEIVQNLASTIEKIELNADEQAKVLAAYKTKDAKTLNETLFTVQNEFRMRFFSETLFPVMQRLYRLRVLAVFLDRNTYNNYVMKTASLYEAFSHMTAQLSMTLLKAEVEKLNQSFMEVERARSEYRAYGPTIEE